MIGERLLAAIILAMPSPPPTDYMIDTDRRPSSQREWMEFYAAFKDERRPALADVLRAENILVRFRCIGSMGRWRRTFSVSRDARTLHIDPTLIRFGFLQAGVDGKAARRRITTLHGSGGVIDDRNIRVANGVYSTRTHLATIAYCGPNRGPGVSGWIGPDGVEHHR